MEHLDGNGSLPCIGMDQDQTNHGSLNISDVIEVLQTTDPEFVGASTSHLYNNSIAMEDSRKKSAYVTLLEQPASKALRFRYECEGRSAGSIPGVNSTPENKTFPSIQVVGYKGRAVVVVSCVTKDPPYRPHPHNLVGKEGCKKGVCTVEMNNENMSVTFSNLGIQCVKKKDIEEALRVREEIRVDPYRTGFAHRGQPTSIDLNAVRLCFQVFLEGAIKNKFTVQLDPIVSDPIFDKKAMSDLVICKLSDCSCSVAGGKEIILLCEKVAKEDIQVRFYEERSGHIMWEGFGDFQPTQVHKQVAISFRSPRYSSLEVDAPVKVNIQLRRPSDGATSEPLPFELLPLDSGRPAFWSMRKTLAKKGNYAMFSSILASNTAMLTNRENPVVEISLDDDSVQKEEETKVEEVANVGNDTADETEPLVGQVIVDSSPIGDSKDENFNEEDMLQEDENCRSFNELMSQVVELDVIYSDTKARLLQSAEDSRPADVTETMQDLYNDNETYSSLQLAMRNPIEVMGVMPGGYEDIVPLVNNKREQDSDSKLPPLPPKRAKKNPPSVPTRPAHLLISEPSTPIQAPNKNLPPVPEPSPKSQAKQNLFQKLFSKKSPKGSKMNATPGQVRNSDGNVSAVETMRKASVENINLAGEPESESNEDVPIAPGDLTELEHMALYTDIAPHASASEFDEMSFYYSPVEGGKIVSAEPNSSQKVNDVTT